jgi:hypothetical protein
MWSDTAVFASGIVSTVTFPAACTVVPSDMLLGATVTLFVTVVLAAGVCATAVSTLLPGELQKTAKTATMRTKRLASTVILFFASRIVVTCIVSHTKPATIQRCIRLIFL